MGAAGDAVKGLYEAFARGDVPVVLGALAPAIEWIEAEHSPYVDESPYVGAQQIAERLFTRLVTDIEGFTVAPHNVIDGGDTVVAEGRYRGRVKATGKPLDAQFAHVWQFRDGKVVRFQQYTDSRQWSDVFTA